MPVASAFPGVEALDAKGLIGVARSSPKPPIGGGSQSQA
jgi:hypothetical protein